MAGCCVFRSFGLYHRKYRYSQCGWLLRLPFLLGCIDFKTATAGGPSIFCWVVNLKNSTAGGPFIFVSRHENATAISFLVEVDTGYLCNGPYYVQVEYVIQT